MEELFYLKPVVNPIEIQDAIYSRLNKTKAILNCMMFSTTLELDNNTLYHALWVADGFLDELHLLFNKLIP